jgi:formylglycine-generating enzyme required for sulfatase activity
LNPVSNREFLDFVRANPQWHKSRIAGNLHDGNYLKHWDGDETVKASEVDDPVRYVSFYAASAFCKALGKKLPDLHNYRTAANPPNTRDVNVSYETTYKVPNFHFMRAEWTDTAWEGGSDSEKRLPYQYGTTHSRNDSPDQDKRYTGRSLGFRCAER